MEREKKYVGKNLSFWCGFFIPQTMHGESISTPEMMLWFVCLPKARSGGDFFFFKCYVEEGKCCCLLVEAFLCTKTTFLLPLPAFSGKRKGKNRNIWLLFSSRKREGSFWDVGKKNWKNFSPFGSLGGKKEGIDCGVLQHFLWQKTSGKKSPCFLQWHRERPPPSPPLCLAGQRRTNDTESKTFLMFRREEWDPTKRPRQIKDFFVDSSSFAFKFDKYGMDPSISKMFLVNNFLVSMWLKRWLGEWREITTERVG